MNLTAPQEVVARSGQPLLEVLFPYNAEHEPNR